MFLVCNVNIYTVLGIHKCKCSCNCLLRTEQNMIYISTWEYIYRSLLETKHIYKACTSDVIWNLKYWICENHWIVYASVNNWLHCTWLFRGWCNNVPRWTVFHAGGHSCQTHTFTGNKRCMVKRFAFNCFQFCLDILFFIPAIMSNDLWLRKMAILDFIHYFFVLILDSWFIGYIWFFYHTFTVHIWVLHVHILYATILI